MTRKGIYAPEILISGAFVTDHIILMENDIITDIVHRDLLQDDIDIDYHDHGKLIPGFIDIQVNGGGGILFNDDPSVEAINAIGVAHQKFGTTAFFPTLISDDLDKIEQAITAVDTAISRGIPGVSGIHLEGPFLNKEKNGIHDACKFSTLDKNKVALLSSLSKGRTLVTLAPEMAEAEFIVSLVAAGVVVSVGHSNATYEQAMQAMAMGVTGFTHLYNAMSPFQSRAPGVVGAAFMVTNSFASLIADGFHVHPAALNHAIKTKGVEKTILITDAMPTVGATQQDFWLGNQHITATNGKCQNDDGVLAGSCLDMASAVRFIAKRTDYSLEDAVAMASLSPARFMGIDDKMGEIKIGKKANFALLNKDLNVIKTWINGVKCSHS
ncbi:MAG: N-acetylglucosamine-6-phosphate deacetylase [Emcibacter sp.]|nr:N-acetylglucosamine-6-phosphate deacetylase [Emcibacter sp.]